MKFNTPGSGRRFGRATRSVALTALVLACVALINVLFTVFASSGLWFIDLTTYSRNKTQYDANGNKITVKEDYELYTLTPGAVNLLDNTIAELNASRRNKGEEDVKVELIFCDDPDNLMSNKSRRLTDSAVNLFCLQAHILRAKGNITVYRLLKKLIFRVLKYQTHTKSGLSGGSLIPPNIYTVQQNIAGSGFQQAIHMLHQC